MQTENRSKETRAKERVKELKDFYSHFGVYLAVNSFITIAQVYGHIQSGATFAEAIFNFGTFAVWFFWGIGLAGHAVKVFSFNPLFGKDWEKRQIQKYMDRERTEVEKYNQLDNGRY